MKLQELERLLSGVKKLTVLPKDPGLISPYSGSGLSTIPVPGDSLPPLLSSTDTACMW